MKISAFALAAVLSIGGPALALAQTTPETLAPSSDPAASQQLQSNNDFGLFLNGIGGSDFTSAFDILDRANSISVIKVSTMPNADSSQLDAALADQQSNISALQARVASNPKAKATLDAGGFSVDQVVGIDAANDGSVTLYVNDWAKAGAATNG